jgi:hypothetical protein
MTTKTTVVQSGTATRSIQDNRLVTHVPLSIKRRGARKVLVAPTSSRVLPTAMPTGADPPLLIALGRAFYWQRRIDDGEFVDADALAKRLGLDRTVVKETLRFTLLAPDIIRAIVAGAQPRTFTLQQLRRRVPTDWSAQRSEFGFDATVGPRTRS